MSSHFTGNHSSNQHQNYNQNDTYSRFYSGVQPETRSVNSAVSQPPDVAAARQFTNDHNYTDRHQKYPSDRRGSGAHVVDVKHSKLTATAKEFTPNMPYGRSREMGERGDDAAPYNDANPPRVSSRDGDVSTGASTRASDVSAGASARGSVVSTGAVQKQYPNSGGGRKFYNNDRAKNFNGGRNKKHFTTSETAGDDRTVKRSGSNGDMGSQARFDDHELTPSADQHRNKFFDDNRPTKNNSNRFYQNSPSSQQQQQQRPSVRQKFYGSGRTPGTSHVFQNGAGGPVESSAGLKFNNNKFGVHGSGGGNSFYKNNRGGTSSYGNSRTTGADSRESKGNKENWRSRDIDSTAAATHDRRRTNLDKRKDARNTNISTNDDDDDDSSSVSSYHPKNNYSSTLVAGSHRERLEEQLRKRTLECLVCCERLKESDQIWNCNQCYHILHLECVRCWAQSSKAEDGWRCPACQNVVKDVPREYRCFCGRQRHPEPPLPGDIPHTCGDTCARRRKHCQHPCTLQCHPGPCPECRVSVRARCGCGATQPMVLCGAGTGNRPAVTCSAVCSKLLKCGQHQCAVKCHGGECEPCKERIRQECYCGKQGRKVLCTNADIVAGEETYGCGDVCDKLLACGNHRCKATCHAGSCGDCELLPDAVRRCHCGQSALTVERKSCLDPISCCSKICGKPLKCGQPSAPHCCPIPCHEGACPSCPLTTMVRCRCGHMDQEMACIELTSRADDARCKKKCTKKRQCTKHKCNQMCCIDSDHPCPLPCSRLLSCGLHRCPLTCHRGQCPRCDETGWQELYCECGAGVLYPPVPCGTKPPSCTRPCSRDRPCGHEPLHACHTNECPPCTVFTRRPCHGGHEFRPAIPCHAPDFSCGRPCGKDMSCGRHKCNQLCHTGACQSTCTLPCTEPRPLCQHPCGRPCHDPPCPSAGTCRQQVTVMCDCGNVTAVRVCDELNAEYQKIALSTVATKLSDMQRGQTVDLSDIGTANRKIGNIRILECNDECKILDRNRRLAIGLQIRNPDISAKLVPRYSEFLKSWAQKNSSFCNHVHKRLTELVELAKQSKQKSRQYSFECMQRQKRQFVHEYAEHFGCESASYDEEPNRNVVATAFRDKSWLPSYSLMEIIQRDQGQRKVPVPVQLNKPSNGLHTGKSFASMFGNSSSGSAAQSSGGGNGAMSSTSVVLTPRSYQPAVVTTMPQAQSASDDIASTPAIDYFNFNGS